MYRKWRINYTLSPFAPDRLTDRDDSLSTHTLALVCTRLSRDTVRARRCGLQTVADRSNGPAGRSGVLAGDRAARNSMRSGSVRSARRATPPSRRCPWRRRDALDPPARVARAPLASATRTRSGRTRAAASVDLRGLAGTKTSTTPSVFGSTQCSVSSSAGGPPRRAVPRWVRCLASRPGCSPHEVTFGLEALNREWVERVATFTPKRPVVLDLDSSESPTYGEQEGSAYAALAKR